MSGSQINGTERNGNYIFPPSRRITFNLTTSQICLVSFRDPKVFITIISLRVDFNDRSFASLLVT